MGIETGRYEMWGMGVVEGGRGESVEVGVDESVQTVYWDPARESARFGSTMMAREVLERLDGMEGAGAFL